MLQATSICAAIFCWVSLAIAAQLNRTPNAGCVDTNRLCGDWQLLGYCQSNAAYMFKNCPVSCRQCQPDCVDYDALCPSWALQGECDRNPLYMGTYCSNSCFCKKTCKDQVDPKDCKSWAQAGNCGSDFMKLRCRNSCGLC